VVAAEILVEEEATEAPMALVVTLEDVDSEEEVRGSEAEMTVDSGGTEGPGTPGDSVEIKAMEVAVAVVAVQSRMTPCNPYQARPCSDRAAEADPRKRN
jgi:hypothetical protein